MSGRDVVPDTMEELLAEVREPVPEPWVRGLLWALGGAVGLWGLLAVLVLLVLWLVAS